MSDLRQVISFTIHNPAAPNVRCSVLHRHDQRCEQPAAWATVQDLDGSNYRMTAFCEQHWQMHLHSAADLGTTPVFSV